MKYLVEKKDEYAVLTLTEENLNSVKAPILKSEFLGLKNSGIDNVILNLEQVKYVDSSGLSAILTGNRLWSEDKKSFVLTGINHPSVKTLITVSRLDSILTIAATMPEAEKIVMLRAFGDELNNEQGDEETDDEE